MTCDLRDYCRNRRIKFERVVMDEKAANATEIYGAEEILKIDVEHKTTAVMHIRIRDDGFLLLKAVSSMLESRIFAYQFVNTFV